MDPNELRIIFAGRELNNHLKLKVFIPTKVYWMNSYCDSSRPQIIIKVTEIQENLNNKLT